VLEGRYGRLNEHLRARFEEEGLAYNPSREVVPRSLDALRLGELARDLGRGDEVHERLMDAYWRDGVNIGDHGELRRLLGDLPAEDVDRVLASDEYRDRVHASTAQAQSIGVTGIPSWVIDGRLLVPGAQPREVFRQVFEQHLTSP
jgi:predicted DsbA family dithiol-disulfide isomerase